MIHNRIIAEERIGLSLILCPDLIVGFISGRFGTARSQPPEEAREETVTLLLIGAALIGKRIRGELRGRAIRSRPALHSGCRSLTALHCLDGGLLPLNPGLHLGLLALEPQLRLGLLLLQPELRLGAGLLHPRLMCSLLLLGKGGPLLLELRQPLLGLLPALLAYLRDVVEDAADDSAGLVSNYCPGDAGEERKAYREYQDEKERRSDSAHRARDPARDGSAEHAPSGIGAVGPQIKHREQAAD